MSQTQTIADIRRSISAGTTTKYVTRPLLVVAEISCYAISVALVIICMWYYSKMTEILAIFDFTSNIEKFFHDNEFTKPHFFERLKYTLLVVSIVPALFSLLMGRLFTALRKKTNQLLKIDKQLMALSSSNADPDYVG
jgi:hypothetical protein